MRRLDSAVLAGVGTLAVHQLAYAVAAAFGRENQISHSHLATAWILGGLAAIGVLAIQVARSLRSRQHEPLSALLLTSLVAGGYIVMEGVERALDGASALALGSELVFWLGLAAAPLVAHALRLAVTTVAQITTWVQSDSSDFPRPPGGTKTCGRTSVELIPIVVRSADARRRGPPAR